MSSYEQVRILSPRQGVLVSKDVVADKSRHATIFRNEVSRLLPF